MIDLGGLRRACEHHRVPAVLQLDEQLASTRKRLDLGDHREVDRVVSGANVVPQLLLHLVPGDGGNELVASHPDAAMDPPQGITTPCRWNARYHATACWKFGVDEGPVDVEDRDRGHAPSIGPVSRTPDAVQLRLLLERRDRHPVAQRPVRCRLSEGPPLTPGWTDRLVAGGTLLHYTAAVSPAGSRPPALVCAKRR